MKCYMEMMSDIDETVMEMPREPASSECCGGGCATCVYDVYEKKLAAWRLKNSSVNSNIVSDPIVKQFKLELVTPMSHDTNMYCFSAGITLHIRSAQHMIMEASINGEIVRR